MQDAPVCEKEIKSKKKILTLPIIEKGFSRKNEIKYTKFLGGLLCIEKSYFNTQKIFKKEFKIFNIPVLTRIDDVSHRTYKIFSLFKKTFSPLDHFKRKYLKYIDSSYDDIYILKSNSGEAYLTLTYLLTPFIKRNQSKRPLILTTFKYHNDMIRLLCPNLPSICIKGFRLNLSTLSFNIGHQRFFILYDYMHFKQFEYFMRTSAPGEAHYFKFMASKLQIPSESFSHLKISSSKDCVDSMMEKVSRINLNLDKFVYLAPEAQTFKWYSTEFWEKLILSLNDRGYDIFCNIVKPDVIKLFSNFKYAKTTSLSFSEAVLLAKQARKIVSLRSGFTEFLLQAQTYMDVLYTEFGNIVLSDINIDRAIGGFSVLSLPGIDRNIVREIDTTKISVSQCLDKVLENI